MFKIKKRILFLVFLFILVLFLVSCQSKQNQNTPQQPTDPNSDEALFGPENSQSEITGAAVGDFTCKVSNNVYGCYKDADGVIHFNSGATRNDEECSTSGSDAVWDYECLSPTQLEKCTYSCWSNQKCQVIGTSAVCTSNCGVKNCQPGDCGALPDGCGGIMNCGDCPIKGTALNLRDSSFGSSGWVQHIYGDVEGIFATSGKAVKDNKFIVGGRYYGNNKYGLTVARLKENGELDPTFGDNGKVMISTSFVQGWPKVAIDSKDRVLIAGSPLTNGLFKFMVVRLTPDGKLDNTFGTGGKVIFAPVTHTNSDPFQIEITKDNKVILAGSSCSKIIATDCQGVLAKLNEDGSFDKSFGSGGLSFNPIDTFYLAEIDSADRIIALDYSPGRAKTFRFLSNGKLDTTFGQGGSFILDDEYGIYIESLAIDPQQRIVLAGYHTEQCGENPCDKTLVARYTQNGMLDTSFGIGGIYESPYWAVDPITDTTNSLIPKGISFDAQGRIILGGGGSGGFAVWRLQPNGQGLDTTFGENGMFGMFTAVEPSSIDFVEDMDQDAKGRFVLTSGHMRPYRTLISVVRVLPQASA